VGTLEEDTALVMVTDGVVEGPDLTLHDGLERAGNWPFSPSTTN
jgi:hypothetical protein